MDPWNKAADTLADLAHWTARMILLFLFLPLALAAMGVLILSLTLVGER